MSIPITFMSNKTSNHYLTIFYYSCLIEICLCRCCSEAFGLQATNATENRYEWNQRMHSYKNCTYFFEFVRTINLYVLP